MNDVELLQRLCGLMNVVRPRADGDRLCGCGQALALLSWPDGWEKSIDACLTCTIRRITELEGGNLQVRQLVWTNVGYATMTVCNLCERSFNVSDQAVDVPNTMDITWAHPACLRRALLVTGADVIMALG